MLCFIVAAALAGAAPGNAPLRAEPVPRQADAAPVRAIALAPGDTAPAFTLKGSDGRTYRLQDFRGKQAVVIAWFAKAFTGG
jgi:hypothetical protein